MRITAGILKNRVLKGVSSLDLRPTTERVREAVFSSLLSITTLEQKKVLELYAGSGAMGIEFISRGAASCEFVEKNKKNHKQLIANLELLNIVDKTKTSCCDSLKFLEKMEAKDEKYDLVFVDPPYGQIECGVFLNLLENAKCLAEDAIVIFEDNRELKDGFSSFFSLVNVKKYGKTSISFFKYRSN